MKTHTLDKITLTIIQKRLEAITEEMALVLKLTSFSPNIKERADFSTAIFTSKGELIAQAKAIPVHLGSMQDSVLNALNEYKDTFKPGDAIYHNSPYRGGTHLPDITSITPVFLKNHDTPSFFVANRAHHSDVGGKVPGSMPGISKELYEEGIIIPPIKLIEEGKQRKDIMQLLLENVRTPQERYGDLMAQYGANTRGVKGVLELIEKYGEQTIMQAQYDLLRIAENAMKERIQAIPNGEYEFTDYLDNDGITETPIPIHVTLHVNNQDLTLDFTGTAPQSQGNANAPFSVTKSAVYYVALTLLEYPNTLPINQGAFNPIHITAPEGSIVNPRRPAAVSSGNTEVSQRIVDVVFGAFSKATPAPAASQGTMNNILIGGYLNISKTQAFTYYETLGGGAGAYKNCNGEHAIHTHMTNTLNTPIEVLETTYPMQVIKYQIRQGSGGNGEYHGGNGLIRAYRFLVPVTISLQTERRHTKPYGMYNGDPAQPGENLLITSKQTITLNGRTTITAQPGDTLIIKTPGGGGYNKKQQKTKT